MEEVRRSDGTVVKCYRKISVCCKAATCEFGIMCQVGEKIEAECKVCEGQGICNFAFKEDALACEKIQAVLSDKGKESKSEEKVVQFPVDMDEIQRNILVKLLNARKECIDQNLLTARGCVAIIDALFYLVKESSSINVYDIIEKTFKEGVIWKQNGSDLLTIEEAIINTYMKVLGVRR